MLHGDEDQVQASILRDPFRYRRGWWMRARIRLDPASFILFIFLSRRRTERIWGEEEISDFKG